MIIRSTYSHRLSRYLIFIVTAVIQEMSLMNVVQPLGRENFVVLVLSKVDLHLDHDFLQKIQAS